MDHRFCMMDAKELAQIRPGLFGAIVAGEQATVVRWEFAPGMARTGIHWHDDHEQFGLVVSGRIETEIAGEVRQLGPGDIYYVPRKVPHGHTLVIGDEPVALVDFFTPPRADYVAAASGGAAVDPVNRT